MTSRTRTSTSCWCEISREHRWMHIEKLQEFDGELGFTRDQGEN